MGKEVILGIDLGTTNSCVAIMEGGKSVVIPNSEGKSTTPSVVGFTKEDRKVGDPAKRQSVTNPKNTIYSIKRFIGQDFDNCSNEIVNVPFDVVNSNGTPSVDIDGKIYTAQEISSMVLLKMKKTAEDYLGTTINKAVITVPAFFNDQQRKSTIEAGKIAGLEVERIINEPTAAALAYGLDKSDEDKKILVYDFGGGTHDVSVLELGDGVFEVLSTDGDTHLGGDNVDEVIIDWLANEFKEENNGLDLKKDPMALQRLKDASEKAKIELSSTTSTEINLPYIMPVDNVPKHLVRTLSRSKFDQLISDIVDKTMLPVKSALKSAGLDKSEIEDIILVGGSTRIPAIQKAVSEFFGKDPNKSVNPDQVVALGAAIQGGVLSGDVDGVLLLDVTPLSLGIETMGGVFTKLIDSNTTIPTTKSQVFSTAADNQSSVDIHIAQGERELIKFNKTLGRFQLTDIPPSPRGVPQIEVSFDIDSNGVISVSAKDKATGKEQSIKIEGNGQLSDEEIERMRNDAELNAEADKKAKEEIEKINNADSLVFNTEKQLKEHSDKLSEENVDNINLHLSELKKSISDKDFDKIDTDTSNLNDAWNKASTEMYNESDSSNDDSNVEEDNIDDVDFEEVD